MPKSQTMMNDRALRVDFKAKLAKRIEVAMKEVKSNAPKQGDHE